jgi:hypothetical protein
LHIITHCVSVLNSFSRFSLFGFCFVQVLNFMMTRSEPNKELGGFAHVIMTKTVSAIRPSIPDTLCGWSPQVIELVTKCWDCDPGRRPPTFDIILKELEAVKLELELELELESSDLAKYNL